MSVVTTWVAVPNRIEALARYLLERRRVRHHELCRLFSPSTLNSEMNVVEGVIQETRRLGLIESDDDHRWSLTQEAAAAKNFRSEIGRVLLTRDRAVRAEQGRVAPAIAWFLTQDSSRPLPIGENWRTRVTSSCPAADHAFDLANSDSCRQFAFWAVYMGFGWRLASGDREFLVPDPTIALDSSLRATMQPGETVPIGEAIERVAAECPVFESGNVREDVERALVTGPRREEGQLSRSTSLALLRLADRGMVRMPSPLADARVMTLDSWGQPLSISHLQLHEGTK